MDRETKENISQGYQDGGKFFQVCEKVAQAQICTKNINLMRLTHQPWVWSGGWTPRAYTCLSP